MKSRLLLLIVAFSLLFVSCLKSSDPFAWEADKGSIVVEIYDASAYGPFKFLFLSADPPSEQLELLTIKFHAPRALKPSKDIQVVLEEDPDAVIAAGLIPLPASAFKLDNTTLTIPQTTGTFTLPVTINKTSLDLNEYYGIAFKINSASEGTISELAKSIVVVIVIF